MPIQGWLDEPGKGAEQRPSSAVSTRLGARQVTENLGTPGRQPLGKLPSLLQLSRDQAGLWGSFS